MAFQARGLQRFVSKLGMYLRMAAKKLLDIILSAFKGTSEVTEVAIAKALKTTYVTVAIKQIAFLLGISEATVLFELSNSTAIERIEERVSSVMIATTAAKQDVAILQRIATQLTRSTANQSIEDVGENSEADGLGVLKTWVRFTAVREPRSSHDGLVGKTVPMKDKFLIESRSGSFLASRPHDPSLPIGETINCGHGIVLSLPRGARFSPWNGS